MGEEGAPLGGEMEALVVAAVVAEKSSGVEEVEHRHEGFLETIDHGV